MRKRHVRPRTELAEARIKCGYTQAFIAEKLGIKQPSYSAIEAGRVVPSVVRAQLIAEIVRRDVADLWPIARSNAPDPEVA